ncbi:MAG: hypothetical protein Q8K99_03760 [Actinomycetota bacterium]|nr:hypothetical protein [Actinomycetota bacterium]
MDVARCAACGDQLIEEKSFCASCGTVVNPSPFADPVASPAPAAVRNVPKPKTSWIVAGVILAIVLAGGSIGGVVMAQNRAAERSAATRASRLGELKSLYAAAVAVESASEVGVNYSDYGRLVREAAAALAVYEPKDADAKAVAADLGAAIDFYKSANDVWAIKFDDSPAVAFTDFKAEHPELDAKLELAGGYVDNAIQEYWAKAAIEMDAARKGLSDYDNSGKR